MQPSDLLAAALRRIEELEARVKGLEGWTSALDQRLGIKPDGEPPARHLRLVRSLTLAPVAVALAVKRHPGRVAAVAFLAGAALAVLWGSVPPAPVPPEAGRPPVVEPAPSRLASPTPGLSPQPRPSSPPAPVQPTVVTTRPAPSGTATRPEPPAPTPTEPEPTRERCLRLRPPAVDLSKCVDRVGEIVDRLPVGLIFVLGELR